MRLVYIDEAGISSRNQEPYIVVAGAIVNADIQLRLVEDYIRTLVEKYVRPHERDGFVFHASEIFNGGKTMLREDPYWSIDRRMSLAHDLAQIPNKFDLRVMLGYSIREISDQYLDSISEGYSLKEFSPKDKTMHSLLSAFAECVYYVEDWMQEYAKNENCMLVVENNDQSNKMFRQLQSRLQKIGKLDNPPNPGPFPIKYIREDPLFKQKTSPSVLEISDFCAYVAKRFLNDVHREKIRPYLEPWSSQIVSPGWIK